MHTTLTHSDVVVSVRRETQKRRARGQYLEVKLVAELESGHLLVELLQLGLGGRALDGLLRQTEKTLCRHGKAHPTTRPTSSSYRQPHLGQLSRERITDSEASSPWSSLELIGVNVPSHHIINTSFHVNIIMTIMCVQEHVLLILLPIGYKRHTLFTLLGAI